MVPGADQGRPWVDLDRDWSISRPTWPPATPIPYEATYAILDGSRILRALETGDVAISKRAGGEWAHEHLPERWQPALRAAVLAYGGQATAEDVELLASEMAPFVAMVRERLPTSRTQQARWSGS